MSSSIVSGAVGVILISNYYRGLKRLSEAHFLGNNNVIESLCTTAVDTIYIIVYKSLIIDIM